MYECRLSFSHNPTITVINTIHFEYTKTIPYSLNIPPKYHQYELHFLSDVLGSDVLGYIVRLHVNSL